MMLSLSVSLGSILLSDTDGEDIIVVVSSAAQEDGSDWLQEDGTQVTQES